jgi:hypothetical protein
MLLHRICRRGHSGFAAAASCAVVALAGPSVAVAEEAVARVSAPTPVAAWGGFAVFSVRQEVLGGDFPLARWSAGGGLQVAPIPARPEPFDADVGPCVSGRPTVVYSRCRTHGRRPSGRSLYRWSVGAPAERAIAATSRPGTSQTHPSIWRRRLAWVRTNDRGEPNPQVLLRTAGFERPRRLAGVPTARCAEFDEMWLLRPSTQPPTGRSTR